MRIAVLPLYNSHETKAPPLNRANHGLAIAVVARNRASFAHDLSERRITDYSARPELLEELVFVDDSIAILEQIDEQIEGFRLCFEKLASRFDLAQAGIHFAVAEAIDRTPFEC